MLTAFIVTGLPALLIILVILAVVVHGIISFVRLTARGARRVIHAEDHDSRR
jgi:Na+-transporting methylmalonyl-CoA/oxaloacetate decarboxylase gamma subunit